MRRKRCASGWTLTTWLWQALTDVGLPMTCLDARKAALNMRTNKTDANDAEGPGTLGLVL